VAGVAEVLDYLRNGFSQSIIHGDVKSSNILLSEEFEPHV
jgi:serine/threonine protein kinase